VCLQLYDRISSKVVSPTRAPPSDAVQKCREVAEALREFDQNSPELESDLGELEELRDILARPHVRVSTSVCFQTSISEQFMRERPVAFIFKFIIYIFFSQQRNSVIILFL
jgi:hypothetical protein